MVIVETVTRYNISYVYFLSMIKCQLHFQGNLLPIFQKSSDVLRFYIDLPNIPFQGEYSELHVPKLRHELE